MIIQLYILDYTWIIGVAILIGLSLVLSFISEGENVSFITILTYMTIINGFIVSAGVFPMWTQVAFLLAIIGVAILRNKRIS